MAAALGHFLPCLVSRQLHPFRNDMEIAGDLEQRIEDKWPRLGDRFFHGQDAHEMIAHAQMVTFRFDIGIAYLEIEKLAASWDCRRFANRRNSTGDGRTGTGHAH